MEKAQRSLQDRDGKTVKYLVRKKPKQSGLTRLKGKK